MSIISIKLKEKSKFDLFSKGLKLPQPFVYIKLHNRLSPSKACHITFRLC